MTIPATTPVTTVEPVLSGAGLGRGVDVDLADPIDFARGCDRCGMLTDEPVATVAWPMAPADGGGLDHADVGRSCLTAMVEEAAERKHGDGQVIVTLPTWSSAQLAVAAEVTYRQLDSWVKAGHVVSEEDASPGSGYQRIYLADQVHRARMLGQLAAAGLRVSRAVQLLATDPQLADALVAALPPVETAAA